MTRPRLSCDNCGTRGERFISPYWEPERGYCPKCCFELNRHYDAEGWPPLQEAPEPLPGKAYVRPGASYSGYPTKHDQPSLIRA